MQGFFCDQKFYIGGLFILPIQKHYLQVKNKNHMLNHVNWYKNN